MNSQNSVTSMFGRHFSANTTLKQSLLADIIQWARDDMDAPGLTFEPLVFFPFAFAGSDDPSDSGGQSPVEDPLTVEIQANLTDGDGGLYSGCTAWRFDLREIVKSDFEDCEDEQHRRNRRKFAAALRGYADELLTSLDDAERTEREA